MEAALSQPHPTVVQPCCVALLLLLVVMLKVTLLLHGDTQRGSLGCGAEACRPVQGQGLLRLHCALTSPPVLRLLPLPLPLQGGCLERAQHGLGVQPLRL